MNKFPTKKKVIIMKEEVQKGIKPLFDIQIPLNKKKLQIQNIFQISVGTPVILAYILQQNSFFIVLLYYTYIC